MTAAAMKGAEVKDDKKADDVTWGQFFDFDIPIASLPRVRIDGPYGAPAEDVFKNEIAVLIGAGIGKWWSSFWWTLDG